MGRHPCCEKVGVKKGPWTPEEDIILVSYIQQHGPGNWRSVPTNTGLSRCSKSCRLRWTNYLRPGIKRGNFTPQEEGMIIHLQALLGNKWAAIATYLPQRTDNDIKNYWNTHLKKKLNKSKSASNLDIYNNNININIMDSTTSQSASCDEPTKSFDFTTTKQSSTYASSTENISRLLQGWMKSQSSSSPYSNKNSNDHDHENNNNNNNNNNMESYKLPKVEEQGGARDIDHNCDRLISHDEFESIFSFDNSSINNVERKHKSSEGNAPFKFLEKLLLDDDETSASLVEEEMIKLSSLF